MLDDDAYDSPSVRQLMKQVPRDKLIVAKP